MVDGDEEVDTILLEFNVSVCCLFVCVGAFGFLDFKDLKPSGVVRGARSCPET